MDLPILPVHCSGKPYVEIIEQPASGILRFRYESELEGRSAGSIVGAHTTADVRTYPTIKVMNYQGPYAVVVSCVTKNGPPYRPHPHNLIGREGCKRGVCTLLVNNADMTCSFTNLGILCVKRENIKKSLKVREAHKLDPFGTGFNHPGKMDLSVLRLCFQVFIVGPDNSFSTRLQPVVSDPIYDKKAAFDLTIMKLSHYSASVTGGTEAILLCDRVAKEDIQIWFYEEQNQEIVWESQAEFRPSDVHKQVAISFRTPGYYNKNVRKAVDVFVQLRKPSVSMRGEPRCFRFLPMDRDPERLGSKRIKAIDLNRFIQGGAVLGSSLAQDHEMLIVVPRISQQTVRQQENAAESPITLGSDRRNSFVQPSTSFAEYSTPTSVSVHVVSCTTCPQFTLAQSPAFAGAHNQTPVASPLDTMPSPIFQQIRPSTSFAEYSTPTILTPVSVPVVGSTTCSQFTLAQSPAFAGAHNQTPVASPLDTMPPIVQQIMPQCKISGSTNETHSAEEVISEKLDSLDLDFELSDLDESLTQNLSASLFDSVSSITDALYQIASPANKQ